MRRDDQTEKHVSGLTMRRGAGLLAAALAAVLAFGPFTGCIAGTVTPSGPIETESRQLGSFQRITLTCQGELKIVPAKSASLMITAAGNVLKCVQATVKGTTLVIELKRGGIPVQLAEGAQLEMVLATPEVTTLENTGSGRISGGAFDGTQLAIVSTGSGKVALDKVNVLSLSTEITGSGGVSIAGGVVGAQQVEVSGSGSFDAPNLESRVATARVIGSGNVEVWATEGLGAEITGSGSVRYWGEPRLTEEASGSGKVISLGTKGVPKAE